MFEELLLACQEIAELCPDGVVFIGGIAVYLHAINNDLTKDLAETTHDADFYISIADMSDLRDIEEVTPNRRLSKHQLIKRGFEFDIYTERHSALVVPYDQVMALSEMHDTIRVAALEHLLVLKLEAYRQRRASSKGQKDAKDIIRIALIASTRKPAFNQDAVRGYLGADHLELLEQIQRGPEMLALARGNSKQAKSYREQFERATSRLRSRD